MDIAAFRVRDGPSTRYQQTGTLYRDTPVVVRCAATACEKPWYQLVEPHPDKYVSESGLAFPDGARPPRC